MASQTSCSTSKSNSCVQRITIKKGSLGSPFSYITTSLRRQFCPDSDEEATSQRVQHALYALPHAKPS